MQYLTSSLNMGGLIKEEYEEIIHVDDEPFFSNHILEEVIYEVLECDRGVVEIKEHDSGFK